MSEEAHLALSGRISKAEISEALWDTPYRPEFSVAEQVEIARLIKGKLIGKKLYPSVNDIAQAFVKVGVRRPPVAYAVSVAERLRRLYPR